MRRDDDTTGGSLQADISERALFARHAMPAASTALPALISNAPPATRLSGLSPPWLGARFSPFASSHVSLLPRMAALRRALSTEMERDTGAILIPVFLAVGAILYFSSTTEPSFLALGAASLCLMALTIATRSRPAVNLMLAAVLFCVLGALAAKCETWRAGTAMLGGEISTRLTGRVVEVEHLATGRIRLTLDVLATERPVLRYAPGRVRVSARASADDFGAGDTVVGLVRLMPPSGPVRPGSYDFSFESYFDGIGASGFFMSGPARAATQEPASAALRFAASVERVRTDIAKRIRDRIGGAEGEIAAALVVGVRAGIPEDVNEALRRAGIYHVISISGLHMALVAGTIMGLLRAGFALFPDFSARHPVKKFAAALAIAGLAAYLFISGGEVAAQRSFIMLCVMLIAVLFDRAALTMRNLAISAVVVILISPHEVVGPSFQMSFAATAALVGAYAAWSDYRSTRLFRAPPRRSLLHRGARAFAKGVGGLLGTSLVAGGATAIYAAYHFQQMPSLGLFTNLTAMPVVSVLVMPFAVLGMLAMPFGLDGPFFDVMGLGLSITIAIARWFAERSPLDIVGLVAPSAVLLLTVALIIAAVCTTWLRIAAIPVLLVGLLALPSARTPDLLVSEDARLVGLAVGDGRMAVNRARPSAFTADNWRRALEADTMVPPVIRKRAAEHGAPPPAQAVSAFTCESGLCLARHPSGAVVAHAVDALAAGRACAVASVIIVDDATASDVCRESRPLVLTKRDLARRGSAAISFATPIQQSSGKAVVVAAGIGYAVATPYRPWHEHRRFSRPARGLAPYSRPPAGPAASGGG